MIVREVVVLPLDKLVEHPDNPKKPFSSKSKRGLRESLAKYGFAGVCIVAPNDDGTYEVLDANTRRQELDEAGVERVPCVIMHDLKTREERNLFSITYDRHKKIYDDVAVVRQLREIVDRGFDAKHVEKLTGIDNIAKYASISKKEIENIKTAADGKTSSMSSLVIYGPSEEIESIKQLAAAIKKRMSISEKIRSLLEQANEHADWSDGTVVAFALAVIAKIHKALLNEADKTRARKAH
jgi:hypothetical protein